MARLDDLSSAAATDVGRKRAHNEDNFLVDAELGLYIVADGMGGHAAGEVASALAVDIIQQVLRERLAAAAERLADAPATSERRLQQIMGMLEVAVNTASSRIHAEGEKDNRHRGMGTTVSLILFRDGHAFVAHVGDSRIYLLRAGDVKQVTDDHTVARELLRLGMVTPDKLHTVPKKNAITRAVGVYPHVQVDTLSFEVLPDDRFLLCSDGLAGYLDDTGEALAPRLEPDDGEAIVRDLVAFANQCGGKDNITAVYVRVGGGDGEDARRARRVAQKRDVLAALPLFASLNERQLLGITAVADVRSLPAGHEVVREGDPGDAMYVVLDGRLVVSKGAAPIGELGPGEQFGEMGLVRANPRSATVTTAIDTELVCLRRDDFFDILRNDPHGAVKLLWQFIDVLADRLDRTSLELSEARRSLALAGRSIAPDTTPSPHDAPLPPPSLDAPTREPPASRRSSEAGLDGAKPTRRPESADETPTRPFGPPLAARVADAPPAPAEDRRSTVPVTATPTPPASEPGEDDSPARRPTNPGSPDARRRAGTQPSLEEQSWVEAPVEAVTPAIGRSPLAQTMPSARQGEAASIADGPVDSFRPTRETVRLDDAASTSATLEDLRRQFREKLARERSQDPEGGEKG